LPMLSKKWFEESKIDTILRAIESVCRQDGSLKPDIVATLLLQIFNLILKYKISLDRFPEEIERIYSELNKLNEEIKQTKKSLTELKNQRKALTEYSFTLKELENFAWLRESFEEAGLDFEHRDEIHNILCSIRETDYDAQNLIEEVKSIRVIKLTKSELERKCEELEKNLEIYQKREHELKRNWSFLFPAIEVMKELLQRGVNPVNIYNIFYVLAKHQPYLSINDLAKDIDTYGSILGAIYKKKRELENLTIYMQTFDSSRHAVS
jgi:chromosome segregation ATPase